MIESSNKPDAVNPAIALWLTLVGQWRRVTDLDRSADSADSFLALRAPAA